MEKIGSILKFLENKNVLVTGGAGFVAKIFVEKILRSQPNVKKLYLLVRAADQKSANLRLQNEILGKEYLFKMLKATYGENFSSFISEKVVMVAGDITCEDLGIQQHNLKQEMWNNLDAIVNVAATTNFDERYDVSLYLNTFGAKYALDFAKKCTNLQVLVQVSTAYVSGQRGGLIRESPYHMGNTLNGKAGLDIEEEKRLVVEKLSQLQEEKATEAAIKLAMKDMGIHRARTYGWPNVYVFTKALGEMVMMEDQGNIPIVIIRPTMIVSVWKEPYPGWVEGIRTVDSLAVGYGQGKLTFFLGDPEAVMDVIPVDMVVNATIVAMAAHANRPGEPAIYQVGSSLRNPVTMSTLQDIAHRHFTAHPWINKDGTPVIVGQVKVHSTMNSFRRYLTIRYLLPLKALQLVGMFSQYINGIYLDLNRKINFILRLIDIYEPYLFFMGIYDDTNTEKLRIAANEGAAETDVFYFDPKVINWDDFVLNYHIPGVVKHACR